MYTIILVVDFNLINFEFYRTCSEMVFKKISMFKTNMSLFSSNYLPHPLSTLKNTFLSKDILNSALQTYVRTPSIV